MPSRPGKSSNGPVVDASIQKVEEDKESFLSPANLAAIGTLVFGMVTFVVTPYTQAPLLDYKVTGPFLTERPTAITSE